ncbi:restriction endonuclease subunit S [Pontixanthobacter aquaemixtae]|uniref:Restriction endonuclease subunit S n=1 Tax=Pontixanthobacter aquaemixtae TaxID=1958940 RepID=A0A844ZT80_9SPHN|nr:restriction endonuclease subunit S [Pontixanthobacter aquaemixtae]MXO91065.1 restriction endonuclease subunit S [Pontixanthobacter aquaemixtae]
MKTSRQTKPASHLWLDAIPKNWTETRLRFVANVSNSNVDKKSYEGQVPVRLCNYTDVYYNERIEPELEFMEATATPEEIKKFQLREGDVIITKDSEDPADIGVPSLVMEDMPGVVCGYHLSVIRASDPITAAYLQYSIMSQINKAQLYVDTPGVTRFGLDQDTIKSIVVLLPPFGERRQIVEMLRSETGQIDGLIEKKTRFIALLNDKEKSMIAHFVRRGIDATAPTKDSGVEWRGVVPAHWQRARMKNHFKQVKRQGFDDLTVLSVYREFGVIEKASRSDNINKTPEDLSKYQLVEPNDLAINKMKAWQGSMGISPFLGITSPDYLVMKPIGEHNPRYMHHYLRAKPMPWVYRLISNGIRTDQWRLEPEKFLELPVFLPPMDEQEAIANRIDRELDRIRDLIEKTERSIALLKEKRAALITAAVTGKIDVRAAA